MKNELLVRALSEIDDNLIEDARKPLSKRKSATAVFMRWSAALAFCAVIFAVIIMPLNSSDDFSLMAGGNSLAEGSAVELSANTAMQKCAVSTAEVPLKISSKSNNITVCASASSSLLNSEGIEVCELSVRGDTEFTWILDTELQDCFELEVKYDNKTVKLTASVNSAKDKIVVEMKTAQ